MEKTLTSKSFGGQTPAIAGTPMMSWMRETEPGRGRGMPPCTQKMSWSITAASGSLSNTQLHCIMQSFGRSKKTQYNDSNNDVSA